MHNKNCLQLWVIWERDQTTGKYEKMSLRELENQYISKKLLKIPKSFREQKDNLTPFIHEFPYKVKIPQLKWQPMKEMHSRAE